MRKLISKKRIVGEKVVLDSLKRNDSFYPKAVDILLQAQRCWDSLRQFRTERDRCQRYCYGDQWGDMIEVDGKMITESEYLRTQGGVPLKNNLIRRLVRSVVGVYRSQSKEPICAANDRDEQSLGDTMSVTLQVNWKNNQKNELDARGFEEFLISGAVIQKETWGWRNDMMDCWTDLVNPNYVFFDSAMSDVRHWDLSIIGEIHDLTFEQLCAAFAQTPNDYARLRSIYNTASNKEVLHAVQNREEKQGLKNIDFLCPYDTDCCRVIEVWNKEQKPRYRCHDLLNGEFYKDEIANLANIEEENRQRTIEGVSTGMDENDIPLIEYEWFMDDYWYFRFISPTGEILSQGETPYEHLSHPYALKLYPYLNSVIHSFVDDVIDQQRYVNRLITLNDKVIRSSAKGVLLYPKSKLPEDKRPEDIAKEWSRPDGVIFYDDEISRSNAMPQQVASNMTNIGMTDLLRLQVGFIEEISGVSGALQGKAGFAGQSASLYAQQTQNASVSLLDLMESYSSFIIAGATKKVKNIKQFYSGKRIINIVGKRATILYDSEKMGVVEFDLNIVESTQTPIIRQIANEWLMQLWKANAISAKQLIEHGNFPFGDALLESMKADEERMLNGEAPQGVPQEILGQINADPNAIQAATKYLKQK